MKSCYFLIAVVAWLCPSCEQVNQGLDENSSAAVSDPLLASKCEACGNTISTQAEGCPGCGHPNPILIAAEKRRAAEAMRAIQVEERRRDEVRAKELGEMEAKALAEMEERERRRQELKPGTTLLEIEVKGGEKPTQVIIGKHPAASFNGTYQAQSRLVNGYLYYKNENDMHLYFYDQAEGGQKGWSLDHREPDGIKDHYSGGWYYLTSFAYLDAKSDVWRAVP
jgi:uncharacterized OB-fold protein